VIFSAFSSDPNVSANDVFSDDFEKSEMGIASNKKLRKYF